MPENSIAIIPPEGYPNQKNYSIKAVRWIQSEAKERGIEIKHALNVVNKESMDIMSMATMKNLEQYLILWMLLAWMPYSFSRQKQSSTSSVFDHASVVYFDHWQERRVTKSRISGGGALGM